MAKDFKGMQDEGIEQESRAIFKQLRAVGLDSPSFLKTRVLANLQSDKGKSKEVWVLRWLSISLAALCVALLVVHFSSNRGRLSGSYINENYVINLDMHGQEVAQVRSVEIALPEGVHFVSKYPDIVQKRALRLAISQQKNGALRLPFVVRSESSGKKTFKMKVFDGAGKLIARQTLIVNFKGNKEVL